MALDLPINLAPRLPAETIIPSYPISLTGVKHPTRIQAQQWCKCRDGNMHRIALINGSLVLLDHKLEREQALLDLGGKPCGCMKVYLDFQKGQTPKLSRDFQPFIEQRQRRQRARAALRAADAEHPHPDKRTRQIIELLLRHKCLVFPYTPVERLRRLSSNSKVNVTNTGNRPFVKGVWHYKWEIAGDPFLELQVNVGPDWRELIYNAGLAVVDETLIIGIQRGLSFGRKEFRKTINVMAMACNKIADTNDVYRFGYRNAIIGNDDDTKWRFIYMDPTVHYKGTSLL